MRRLARANLCLVGGEERDEFETAGGEVAESLFEGVFGFAGMICDAEVFGQFGFEVAHGAEGWRGGFEVAECALEEIEDFGFRVVGFDGGFGELAEVGGGHGGGPGFPEGFAPIVDGDFAECVERAAAGFGDGDFAGEEEVEFSGERAFRAASAAGDGFDQAVVSGEPVHDEAGFREFGDAREDGAGGDHCISFPSDWREANEKSGNQRSRLPLMEIRPCWVAMNFGAILFDFDGVLVDTEWSIYEAWRRTFLEHGHDLPLALYTRCIGSDFDTWSPKLHLEELTGRCFDWHQLDAERQREIEGALSGQGLMAGAEGLLASLADRGVARAVVSSSSHSWVDGWLARLDLARHVPLTVCRGDAPRIKPAPDLFLEAARQLAVDPAACLVIEDSANGLKAATAAGMTTWVVPNEVTRGLDFSQAERVLESLDEVARLLGVG